MFALNVRHIQEVVDKIIRRLLRLMKKVLCPSSDNKWDSLAMRELNLLTNICPQHGSLNSGCSFTLISIAEAKHLYGKGYITQKVPLLLGNEVFNRALSYSVDNQNNVIKIKLH